MNDPFFFGYGSLVNRATHVYPDGHRATLTGWRREWRYAPDFGHTFLSVVPDAGSVIDGLIARVPGGDWAALDARETGYARHPVAQGALVHAAPFSVSVQVYAVPETASSRALGEVPILRSYLDVVAAGFFAEYGADGVARFFASTTGWADIRDDRAAPLYPRAQVVLPEVSALVDAFITAKGLIVQR
ncbi:MAG: gamma-glutamylcyclotransferase family protein [Roseinatronobacter sp.]